MDITLCTIVKVMKHKSGLLEHAQSIAKWPTGFVYMGHIVYYHIYLPDPFSRGLEVDQEGSSTFPTLMLSMYINRLGLFSYFYGYLFSYITT